jgi:lipid A 3-O-deacylase
MGTRVSALGRLAVGGLWFDRQLPVPDSREFNFTLEMGGSVAFQVRPGSALEVGYKFHHLSNMYTRPENGGVDADLFYIGWHRERWR